MSSAGHHCLSHWSYRYVIRHFDIINSLHRFVDLDMIDWVCIAPLSVGIVVRAGHDKVVDSNRRLSGGLCFVEHRISRVE